MLLSELLASGKPVAGGIEFAIGDDWLQGRTTYGGLSVALAMETAHRQISELPPLRSATVSFIGPAAGRVVGRARELRRGRSVCFVESELSQGDRVSTRCVFAYGTARESAFDVRLVDPPQVPGPGDCEPFVPEGTAFEPPSFTRHFEVRLARGGRPFTGSADHEHLLWVRHRDPAVAEETGLIALADMPPPAILPMLRKPAPTSSMTWLFNLVDPAPAGAGWWLLSTRVEHAAVGYSSQDMLVWNQDGGLAATGRQSVVLFG